MKIRMPWARKRKAEPNESGAAITSHKPAATLYTTKTIDTPEGPRVTRVAVHTLYHPYRKCRDIESRGYVCTKCGACGRKFDHGVCVNIEKYPECDDPDAVRCVRGLLF